MNFKTTFHLFDLSNKFCKRHSLTRSKYLLLLLKCKYYQYGNEQKKNLKKKKKDKIKVKGIKEPFSLLYLLKCLFVPVSFKNASSDILICKNFIIPFFSDFVCSMRRKI